MMNLLTLACYNLRMISMRRSFSQLILLAGLFAAPLSASGQVKVWDGTLALPAYEEGRPDPNPPFDQYSSNTNYPYTLRNQMTGQRSEHQWRAVYLENEYLKCSILPDLGGHLYTCIDKLSNQPMFYANPSIKKAEIGYRGGWAAFGIEFNFPVSHNWVTVSPVDFSYAKNGDGSASVFVGNIDRVYGMQWQVEMVLRPGSTVLELRVTLSNRSDVRNRFYWWSNAGVQVWDDSKVSYPMQFTASHGFTDVDTWPVDSTGTDLSLLKNQTKGPVSRFVHGSREPFMGIWHPRTNTGLVHYAEYEELPGKKIWSWGSDADGIDWRKALSDNDSAYMEVQAGPFRNQETYAFLQPRQAIHFTEYWMPVRGLGGIARANLNGVANMSREGKYLRVAFNANRQIPGATARILYGNDVVASEKLDLAPEHTWVHELDSADSAKMYTFELRDANGAVLLHQTEGEYDWSPRAEIKTGPQNNYRMPAAAERTEDDWVQLAKDEELNGARLAALEDYQRALQKFPSSLALQKAAGTLSAILLRYEEAVRYLEPVESRETWNAETAYYLGIAYDGLGLNRKAMLAFEAAQRLPEFHAAACLRIAELKARQGQLKDATRDLAEALRSAPGDLRDAEELVAVQHALGQTESADKLGTEWLARHPTSYFLREELGQPDNAHLGADIDRILNTAAEYMRMGMYEKALSVLSRDYPEVPADQREPGEATAQNHPLIAYYRGYCKQKMGLSPDADFAAAAKLSTRYVFPSGQMTYKVLQSALQANPKDASANYLMGDLEFSIGMTDDGLAKWEQALAVDAKIPALDASIGRARLHLKGDTEVALAAFKRGATADDPDNLENYFGMDQALSLLQRPAKERVTAISLYPDKDQMPTALVYELALNLAEADEFDKAAALFHGGFFQRAEGGTNVRQVWLEVRLQQSISLGRKGQCDSALELASHLGDVVPTLDFTKDGMQTIVDSARTNFLLGELDESCGRHSDAQLRFGQAASATDPGQIVWAAKASRKTSHYDESAWRARLLSALNEEDAAGTSLGAYHSAMLHLEMGNKSEAEAYLRKALTMPDSQLAYHLSRLALSGENE
jgi:predicted Zn-dependent protease